MSGDLHDQLETVAGSGSRPEVDEVWRTGRRRRRNRRVLGSGVAVVAVLVAGTFAIRALPGDDSQTVQAGAGECVPLPTTRTQEGPPVGSTFRAGLPGPPRTAAAMVHGGGSEHLAEPDIVARVEVVAVVQEPPTPPSAEWLANVNTLGTKERPGERRATVVVTDPVFGARTGERLTISDLGSVQQSEGLREATRAVQAELAQLQSEIDQLDQPLADLDAQILGTPPTDPRYQALIDQRGRVKDQIDPERIRLQNELSELKQQLQLLQINERLMARSPVGTSCHRFEEGDDLVVAVVELPSGRTELTGPSSFFLVDGDGFSDDLDAARRSIPGWADSELLALARRSTPDEFLDRLRAAAGN